MNFLAFWIAIGVLVCSLIALAVIGRKKVTWYRVFLANPEMSEERVFRTFWDKLWLGDWSGIMLFRSQDGKVIRISKHWIIKIVEE